MSTLQKAKIKRIILCRLDEVKAEIVEDYSDNALSYFADAYYEWQLHELPHRNILKERGAAKDG